MDFLKRELAPVPAEAWIEIDAQAARSLKALLSARKVVDLTGPMGTNFPGVPEGTLGVPRKTTERWSGIWHSQGPSPGGNTHSI
ncbi:MAG: family 1 encapsulin nanocompartment shell protein [Deltaproteobacteria bacterium]|nr:family 1 encapsulin nanocompartment shell protein [Deltaproteobacteria bacterium]